MWVEEPPRSPRSGAATARTADELEEGDEREAGAEDAGAVAQRLDVLDGELALVADQGAHQRHQPLDQLGLEADLGRGLLKGEDGLGLGEDLLGEAEASLPSLTAFFRRSSE